MKSIIQYRQDECYICGRRLGLQNHHCWHGTANRKKADEDGLTVMLCMKCHMDLHDHGYEDKWLMKVAQERWCIYYGKTKQDFIERYGKWQSTADKRVNALNSNSLTFSKDTDTMREEAYSTPD